MLRDDEGEESDRVEKQEEGEREQRNERRSPENEVFPVSDGKAAVGTTIITIAMRNSNT